MSRSAQEPSPRSSGSRRRPSVPQSWYADEERYAWRRPDWIGWDSARSARPAMDARGNTVEVWLVAVGLDEVTRFVLETEPLIDEDDD